MTTPPKTLVVAESNKLLDALLVDDGTNKQKQRGLRNYCIGLLMLDAGLRVGEVVQLRIADLMFNSIPRTSIVISADIAKNNEERTIPISTRLSKAIKMMNDYWWPIVLKSGVDSAFYSIPTYRSLTTRQVERFINKAAMESLGRPIHPHILRHTFASRLMRTTNIRIVQQLLGHKDITSTQIYMHPNQRDLTDAITEMESNDRKDAGELSNYIASPVLPNHTETGRTDKDVS